MKEPGPMSENKPAADQFDMLVGGWLKATGAPDSDELAALETFVRALPDRRRAPRFRMPGVPRFALAAGAVVLASAVGATGGFTLYSRIIAPATSPSAHSSASSSAPSPVVDATPLPVVAPPDPAPFVNDERYKACQNPSLPQNDVSGGSFPVIAAVELADERQYRQRLPDLGYVPSLEQPYQALVVVYAGRSPVRDDAAPQPTSHQPDSGLYDVCIALNGPSPQLFHNVSVYWGYLDGSVSSPTAGQPAPKVLAFGCATDIAWDAARRVFWCAGHGLNATSNPTQMVVRYDPASGAIREWPLPVDDDLTSTQQTVGHVRADSAGMVWISHPERVIRFDPGTGKSQSVRLSDVSPTNGDGSSPSPEPTYLIGNSVCDSPWFSSAVGFRAIATDGDTAVVARVDTPYLTRIGPDMAVTQIPIESSLVATASDQQGLEVAGGLIYLTRPSDSRIAILSPDGSVVAVSTAASAEGHSRLDVRPRGSSSDVVVWTGNTNATEIDGAGTTVDEIVVAVNFPRADDGQQQPPYDIASDWNGHYWYLMGTSPVNIPFCDAVLGMNLVVEIDPAP